MFKIRQEQAAVFRREALQRFEDNAVRHLRTHLPGPTGGYTDGELRRRVRDGVPRSTVYGLASEQQVMCFVDTTFLLGERFDTDPAHDWAAKRHSTARSSGPARRRLSSWRRRRTSSTARRQ